MGEDGGGMRRYRDRSEARRNWNRKKKVGKKEGQMDGGKMRPQGGEENKNKRRK